MSKKSFEYVNALAEKYLCSLLHTEQSFMRNLDTINIKSRCGHITIVSISKFVKYRTGVYCGECMETYISEKKLVPCNNIKCKKMFVIEQNNLLFCSPKCSHSRIQTKTTINKISSSVKKYVNENRKDYSFIEENIHSVGNSYIYNLLGEHFYFELTSRCCDYNHLFKPIQNNTIEDTEKWFPIKIKYSNSYIGDNYYFTIRNKSQNILILCVNLQNKKMWLFPPNILNSSSKIKININTTFTEYLLTEKTLYEKLLQYYNNNSTMWLNKYDNLISNSNNGHVNIECEYKLKRVSSINFLTFTNPLTNFETYNFLINGFRVQETVCFYDIVGKWQIACVLKKRNGKIYPFSLEDNDFYWINERTSNNFYVVPNNIMYEKGFVQGGIIKGRININITTNLFWLSDYQYSYDDINETDNKVRLLKVFNL